MSNKKIIEEFRMIERWQKYAEGHLIGKTIESVRYLTDNERKDLGWYKKPLVIHFSDGSLLFPSMDDEGNDGGALFGQSSDGEDLTFPTL